MKDCQLPGLIAPPVDFDRMARWTYDALQYERRWSWFRATTPSRFIHHARPSVN